MGRRRRGESLPQIFLQLPWWVGLIAAAVVYVLFTIVAPALFPQTNQFAPVVAGAARTWGRIIAGLLVLLSIGSAVRAFFSRRLLAAQSSIDSIRSLSWRQFEVQVAESFAAMATPCSRTAAAEPMAASMPCCSES